MPQTRRTDDFDIATRMLRAQAAAEQEAIRHVAFLRKTGATLKEAAEAIGIEPTTWDDVTLAYALRAHSLFEAREQFNRWDHQQDAEG